jgi:hypothetical protein
MPHNSNPARVIGTCPVVFGGRGPCRDAFRTRGREPSRRSPALLHARETMVRDGRMAAWLTLSLRSTWAAWPRAGTIPGRCGGWTGRTCRPTWSGSTGGNRIEPHRNDEVEVLVVVILGRGELTLDGQVRQLAPMVVAHLPKGTVGAIEAVDGPLAYL